ncbi:hypothetical protein F0259_16825 [Vibrio cyclitrophicus]|nr:MULTISPECIES: hypothetical protein [Vibrio]KAA8598078.1 ABC-type multidrug transport system ATPase and permease component [Vibrio cyclitrophicus]MCC4775993.1 hypothetical protein [Vibrio cyclitrophicus]MCC4844164.1 hypothetical protein [Vibrio cyclitrophicus]NOH45459.1 hypothetical protein [Vibrio cyclitrophicus]OBS92007.1 hypothetical protein A9257_16970 [Vibrio cyclitrophicus]
MACSKNLHLCHEVTVGIATTSLSKLNDGLDPSLKEAPVGPISNNRTMIKIDKNTVQMDIVYTSGETGTLTGIKDGQNVSYYMDGQLVSQTTIEKLEKIQGTEA